MPELIDDLFDCEVISEMAAGAQVLLPLTEEQISEISKGDDDPLFATFVIESGWSRNKRYWPPERLDTIREQINGSADPVVGYMGHIKPEDDGFSFPDIQLQWLKASLQPSTDKVKLLVKGYVLPGTKAREYLTRRLIRTISVSGNAILQPIKGGVSVKEFDLESIDLSRPRRAGMKTSLVALTSEMESGEVKPEEIAALQQNELRAHNPTLVKEIEDEAKKPLEEKVGEMEGEAEALKPEADLVGEIRTALGLDEKGDPLAAIGELMTKLKDSAKDMRDRAFDNVLEKKFKNENTRNLVKRLLVTEMASEESVDEDEFTNKVTEMVEEKIETDDDLKALVSETEVGGGRAVAGAAANRGAARELKPGYENENISVSKGGRR